MTISPISLYGLTLAILFRFMTRVIALVNKIGADKLGLEKPFNKLLLPAFEKLDAAHAKPRGSEITGKISGKEKAADNTIDSIFGYIEIGLKSNDPETVAAAKRLKFNLKPYKGVARKSRKAQVADTTNMLQDLKGKFTLEVEKLGFGNLVEELEELNNEIDSYEGVRSDESIDKSMKNSAAAKQEIIEAYRAMCKMAEVLVLVDGSEKYDDFIRGLNQIIKEFGGGNADNSDSTTPVEDENKYPDAKEWIEDLPFMGVENGDIYYILVAGKKVFYKLIDKQKFFWHPESEKGAGGWEKLS